MTKEETREYNKQYYIDNADKIKQYYIDNADKINEKEKQYRIDNADKIKEIKKQYRIDNADKIKQYRIDNAEKAKQYRIDNADKAKQYRIDNADKAKQYYIDNADKRNKRDKERRKTNPLYKLTVNIRSSIRQSLLRKSFKKNTTTHKILGCNYAKFMEHLNNNKYNFKYEDNVYDIDHIIPLSSATTEKEIYKLNYYTNFQLLPSYYNRYVKINNDWNQKDFEKWLKKENDPRRKSTTQN